MAPGNLDHSEGPEDEAPRSERDGLVDGVCAPCRAEEEEDADPAEDPCEPAEKERTADVPYGAA